MMSETPQALAAALAGKAGYMPDRIGILYTAVAGGGGYHVDPGSMSDLDTLAQDRTANVAICRFAFPPVAADGSADITYSGSTDSVFEYLYATDGATYAKTLAEIEDDTDNAVLIGVILLAKPGGVYVPFMYSSLYDSTSYPVRQPGTDNIVTLGFSIGSIS
jgi:hypothetical protein